MQSIGTLRSAGVARARAGDPGIMALLAAMGLWGASYVAGKYALTGAGPFTVLALRLGLATAILGPLASRRGFRWRMLGQKRYVLFGLTGMFLHLGFEVVGLDLTSATSAALVIASAPAVTAAFSIAVLGERLSPANWAGIALSIAGVVLVTGGQAPGGYPLGWLGNLLIFFGVVTWGVFTVQGKRMASDEYPAIVSTTAATGAATLMFIPFSIGEIALQGPPTFDAMSILAIVYLGVFASAIAYVLWNFALEHVDASVAGPFINLVPVIGVILGLSIGETMTVMQVAGGATVALGIYLSHKASARHLRAAPGD